MPLEEALPAWCWGWDRVGTQTVRPRALEHSHTQTSEGGSERGHADSEMLTWKHTWEDGRTGWNIPRSLASLSSFTSGRKCPLCWFL